MFITDSLVQPHDDMGHNLDCAALELFPNEDLYEECKDIRKEVGFDHIEAFYYGNVKTNNYFSRNPEWMVDEEQKFVDEALQRDEPFSCISPRHWSIRLMLDQH